MKQQRLNEVLEKHRKWLAGKEDGQRANLRGANLRDAYLPFFQIPQDGDLTVWKKCSNGIAKLLIPSDAKRTASLIGRKCRCEYAKVLECINNDGENVQELEGWIDQNFKYKVGEYVYADSYDDDTRIECSNGIHFFLTREEAEEW